ncbi:hypothetical protein [Sphingobacterium rhinopitheci]|uniref:hypothetical protein n=1 Tax=Sphingobacterium rhinopitheci TaxID=2781960 RepID=UPI001F527F54|nr:hypothetical protein [Sphingobacterium rhinopitheci]MCI0922276.1 hypothetical protein [Sphingobacterium rhinopitheci]
MGRYTTCPLLIDDIRRLTISDFKKLSLIDFNSARQYTQVINWNSSRTNEITARISVDFLGNGIYKFHYSYNEVPVHYYVEIVSEPSNLGKGEVYYFKCPKSKLKCRTLYLYHGVFVHRSLCKGALYESQIHSKKYRELDTIFGNVFGLDRMYEQLYVKNRKKYYKGKKTKWFSKLRKEIDRAENINLLEFNKLMN